MKSVPSAVAKRSATSNIYDKVSTPKAFASSSPGFALKRREKVTHHWCSQPEKGLRRDDGPRASVATPSELRLNNLVFDPQGFKTNPGLELANAFSVIMVAQRQAGDNLD
jgi:hypothetical protein